ncbi:DUF1501 domain-containing protein [Aeoliella sp.]|uniref:DUF1501 domain-containing protein n=1 Tax=Aeoliella sp. TaxID=2795800 RepID=UPI003CCC3EB5
MYSRRSFLRTSSLLSLAPVLPCVLGRTAQAATSERDAKVLVVLQLDGGNDGINTVVPYADDGYGQARSSLRLEADSLHKLDDQVGLHASMKRAKELFDDGRVAIIQGVGYPNPSRSHFRSMKIWQTGSFDEADHDAYGWLGRAADRNSESTYYVGNGETPVALWGRKSQAIALAEADDLILEAPSTVSATPLGGDALHQYVSQEIATAYQSAARFQQQSVGSSAGEASYPNTQLASRLKLVSQLLKSGSPTRIYYATQSGYDTHSAQLYTHARLLREFSDAVAAFMDDLKQEGLGDRVVLMAFSEFGRRVKENDSKGTDHGTAGPVFLAGSAVQAGLFGAAPDLSSLDDGDLKAQFDFRQIYATLLSDWLDINPDRVLAGHHDKIPLLREV